MSNRRRSTPTPDSPEPALLDMCRELFPGLVTLHVSLIFCAHIKPDVPGRPGDPEVVMDFRRAAWRRLTPNVMGVSVVCRDCARGCGMDLDQAAAFTRGG